MQNPQVRYNQVAIFLHWAIAIAIILQLISGVWMTDAIQASDTRDLAVKTYGLHKEIGICILLLSIFRLGWRVSHTVPPLPSKIKPWERMVVHSIHHLFYILIIGVPLAGWLMVSTSPKLHPFDFFGLFNWPFISMDWLYGWINQQAIFNFFHETHELSAYLLLALLCLHILAALYHHFFEKNDILVRMLPSHWLSVRK